MILPILGFLFRIDSDLGDISISPAPDGRDRGKRKVTSNLYGAMKTGEIALKSGGVWCRDDLTGTNIKISDAPEVIPKNGVGGDAGIKTIELDLNLLNLTTVSGNQVSFILTRDGVVMNDTDADWTEEEGDYLKGCAGWIFDNRDVY